MKNARPREIVVVTGATAGVGRAVVREFARRGARIGLLARDEERLRATEDEVAQLGGEAFGISTDVADSQAVERAADQVTARFGEPDVWINNAMATVFAPFAEILPEEFKRATEVTYLGCVYGTQSALKRMLSRNKGVIVQVGSALAYRSIPLQSAYCGAKHAITGFTDSLRCELIHNRSRVRITMVHLPAMNTPQFSWCKSKLPRHPQPVPPIFEPEVAARAIYWAAHHKRSEVFVGWPTVKAIYGQDVASSVADWYLGTHGFESQQTDEPVSSERPDNLFEPVKGNYAAHGIFSGRAASFSFQNWTNLHRLVAGTGAAAVLGLTALFVRKKVG
jgi:NAD(P)-dependent dehydrogenase (short-subunit alcohol dehydrogenase family)